MSNQGTDHWKAIISVLMHLCYTHNYGLHYTRYSIVLKGYSDANWISNVQNSSLLVATFIVQFMH